MQMKTNKKNIFFLVIFAALYFAGTFFNFQNIAKLEKIYPSWSVRTDTDITDEMIRGIRYQLAQQEGNKLWPTFWVEQKAELKTFRHMSTQKVIYYDGDPFSVFPAEFLSGSYAGEFDTKKAAVSTALAWSLWGSYEVVGSSFELNEKEYEVSGVFKSEEKTAVVNGKEQSFLWKNIEVADLNQTANREEIEMLSQQYTSEGRVHIIDGKGMTMLIRLLANLPMLIGIILLGVMIIRILPRHSFYKSIGVFTSFLILAMSLPYLLSFFPSWLLPTKWSDFSFWINLFETIKRYVIQWFLLVPQDKDLLAKFTIVDSIFLLAVVLLAEWGIWYNSKKILQKKESL